jgi:hypothetical protein
MGEFLKILALVVIGILLLWFGYKLFFSRWGPFYPGFNSLRKMKSPKGTPGDPQVCPICSCKMTKGELVQSLAFPSLTGGTDRLMYIRGCFFCLHDNVPRRCPVCGKNLSLEDYLVSRIFDRPHKRSHVHVLGCNHCKNMGKIIP